MGIQLLFLILALLAVAVLTAAETALIAAPQSQLRQHIKRDKRAQIALDLMNTDHLMPILRGLVILLAMAVAIVNQETLHSIILKLFKVESPERISTVFSTIPLALIILVFSVFVPYVIASKYPLIIALYIAKPIYTLYKISKPFTMLFDWMTGHVAGLDGVTGAREMDRDELNLQIRLAGKDERISAIEAELASNALKLSERRIGSMMTPRTNLHAIDIHDTPEIIKDIINIAPHSRYPLVDKQLENIVGIIALKDLITFVLTNDADRKSLLSNCVPYVMIPDSTNALALLELLKTSPSNMAIAFDEYGNVTGVVTLYDLIENIAGGGAHNTTENEKTIAAHSRAEITPRKDGSFLIDGAMDIADFFESFHMEERIEELQEIGAAYTTVAGYVLAGLGHIPQTAEVLEIDSLRIEVVDMDGNRIDKLMISKMQKENQEDTDSADEDSQETAHDINNNEIPSLNIKITEDIVASPLPPNDSAE